MTEESQSVTVETDTPIDTIESESVIHDTQPQDGSETKTEETTVATSEADEEQPQKPINPRTAQRKAEKERLIRENAYKDAVIAQKEAELAKYKQSEKPTVKERDYSQEPNIQDYDDVLEYTRDLAKYEIRQEFAAKEQQASLATKAKMVESFEERAEALKAEKPDFDEKIEALKNTGLVAVEIEDAIFASDMSADIAYHLAQYPSDLVQLRGLPKETLPKAIKAIEAFIKNAASNPPPRQTQATPPIKPVGSKASITPDLSRLTQEELENMPQHEFEAKYMKNKR